MSKTKEELKKVADDCFKANKNIDVLHQTADGQCFAHWHDANEHSKHIGVRDINEIRRNDAGKGTLTLQEKLDLIEACKTADELTAIEIGNKENPKVKAAMDAKLKEFADAEAKAKK